jgi:hypothetical protein
MLFAVLLFVGVGINITSVRAQTAFVTVPLPNASARNQVIDFYAGGTSEGYTLRASPQGATLSINGLGAITLMPWGYATAQWSQGRIYIIFLANVTQSDFGIGFLYLRNSTDMPFLLRWFDYKSGDINSWTFQGAQHVFNRTVTTVSVDMPKLQIPAAPEVTNALSALGPDLYLTQRGGQLYNGTTLLTIYPLVNQLFGGSTDYNEVWSLLTDRAGSYYFAILYMQNNDAYHVIVEHQLRLNDYRKFDGRTVAARWIKGSFSNQVTVRTGQSNLTILVDDFPFQTNDRGLVSLGVPSGRVNVQVPAEIQNSGSSRLRFSSWSKFGSANPLSLQLNSSLDIFGNYTKEYSLTIATPYGTPIGAGWYARGANASFGVPSEVNSGNGTRMVFEKWQGDANSTSNQTWTVMDSARQVTALWTTQYKVTVTPVGLPDNASAQISVVNSIVTLNGSAPYILWVDENASLSINVQSTQIQQSTTNYVYSGLRVDNQTVTGGLTITKPVDVAVIFTGVPKDSINVNLQVWPTVAAPGIPLSITGSIQRISTESKSISLLYSLNNVNWQRIANVSVSPDGTFSYAYPFTQPGSYYLKAYWPGDSEHSSASQVVNIRIVDSTVPIIGTSDSLTQIMRSVEDVVHAVPYASTLLTLAGTMMTLGYSLTVFVIPGGSPLIGYIIGSFLVGFVYVFPVSAAVAVLRAATSHRRPSFLWLIPLVGLWVLSLGLLVASFLYAIVQPFALIAEVLLLLCNMFLIPIATSLGVARAVA